jgi:hypothetical protein
VDVLSFDSWERVTLWYTKTGLRRLVELVVAHRVAVANQLRAHPATALPAAVDPFAHLDSPISLRFLTRFTTQDAIDRPPPRGTSDREGIYMRHE